MNLINRDELINERDLAIKVYENANILNAKAIRDYLKPLLDKIVELPIIKNTQDWNLSKLNPPEEGQKVLGFDKDYVFNQLSVYVFENGNFVDEDGFRYTSSEVTHWQPLPKPPNIK